MLRRDAGDLNNVPATTSSLPHIDNSSGTTIRWWKHPQVIMITLQQYITAWIQVVLMFLQNLWDRLTGQVLEFEESGIAVRVSSRPLAEGGFSVVYAATDTRNPRQTYALKRIRCHDKESREGCQKEAKVHQTLQLAKPTNAHYLLPLYGMAWTPVPGSPDHQFCYMLFPMMPYSLRTEVNQRIFSQGSPSAISRRNRNQSPFSSKVGPWMESTILQIFDHLVQGILNMHEVGYSHRDIKLENILCKGKHELHRPVLMDFGSAGPLTRPLSSRQDVLEIAEEASQHTTISYRPPELFPGELRAFSGSSTNHPDAFLDYGKVDVWSLGCVFFALLYGASPFESEFDRRTGVIRIVECSQLRVLGPLPKPPSDSPPAQWYSEELLSILPWMLQTDRHQRPTMAQVQTRLQLLREQKHVPQNSSTTLPSGGPPSATSFGISSVQSGEEDFFGSDPFSGRSMTY